MHVAIRPLLDSDRRAAGRLLDDAVGAGFWSFSDSDRSLCFVATTQTDVTGVVLALLAPAGDPDAQTALGASAAHLAGDDLVLHIHELAVAPTARRGGLASSLLARAESEALALGARAAFAFGWLPAGQPEPDTVPFYAAAGYTAGADIADFFAAGSAASGARCPYCGEPPCRCAVRPFVKRLAPGAG